MGICLRPLWNPSFQGMYFSVYTFTVAGCNNYHNALLTDAIPREIHRS